MIVNLFGLARDGKTNSNGMPNLLQAAPFVREVSDVLYFTKPPLVVQRLLFGALAAIARALGYRSSYPKYSGSPEPPSRKGACPPPTTRVVAGPVAVAALLFLTSSFLLGRTRRLSQEWFVGRTSGGALYSLKLIEEAFSEVRPYKGSCTDPRPGEAVCSSQRDP
jgi:hypothetical protein